MLRGPRPAWERPALLNRAVGDGGVGSESTFSISSAPIACPVCSSDAWARGRGRNVEDLIKPDKPESPHDGTVGRYRDFEWIAVAARRSFATSSIRRPVESQNRVAVMSAMIMSVPVTACAHKSAHNCSLLAKSISALQQER